MSRTCLAQFRSIVNSHSQAIAIEQAGKRITYGMLDAHARSLARVISERGVSRSLPIAILFDGQDTEIIHSMLASWMAGFGYVVLDADGPVELLAARVADAQPALLVTDEAHSTLASRLMGSTEYLLVRKERDAEPASIPPQSHDTSLDPGPDDIAALFFTSGSTGRPKAVVHTQQSLWHGIGRWLRFGGDAGQRRLAPFTNDYIAGCISTLGALLSGATLLPVDMQREGLAGLLDRVQTRGATFFHVSVPLLRTFVQAVDESNVFENVRYISLAGQGINPQDVANCRRHFPHATVVHRFSSTETLLVASLAMPPGEPICDPISAGEADPGCTLLILDENRRVLPTGMTGEIAVHSDSLAQGYWRQPEATDERFCSGPAPGHCRIFMTGDMGRLDDKGNLHHLGRKDFQVKVAGYTVDLATIEQALLELESIEQAAVVMQPLATGHERLVACLVTSKGESFPVAEISESLARRLPRYMLPAYFVWLDAMPLAPSGKIDRFVLLRIVQNRPADRSMPVAARTPIEKIIANIWADTLGLDEIGIHDPFLELGGNSLQAMRIAARVQDEFGVEIPLAELFAAGTVAEMALLVAAYLVENSTPSTQRRAR